MRTTPPDIAPAVKPYFYGYWADTSLPAGAWTQLPITTTPILRGGMVLSGGGCKVPVKGLYHIGARCRCDASAAGASYAELQLNLNGASMGATLENNASVGSYYYPYEEHMLWLPQPLNAGDVISAQFYLVQTGTVYGANSNGGIRVLYDSPLA